MHTGTVFA